MRPFRQHPDFLFDTFRCRNHGPGPIPGSIGKRLSDIPQEEERIYLQPAFIAEHDLGPETAWRWAHWRTFSLRFTYDAEKTPLRARGYVMWDNVRLLRWGIPHVPWRNAGTWLRGGTVRDVQKEIQVAFSLEARRVIYSHGGRGWWSSWDHSCVRWSSPTEYLQWLFEITSIDDSDVVQ